MAEEKKDFSAAENIIAPSGAFCDLNGGKADTGGTSSVGYGAACTGNDADRASECSGEVIGRGSDGETGGKGGEVMPGSMKKKSEGAASDGKKLPPPSDGQNGGVFYSAEEVRALLQSEGDRRAVNGRRRRRRRSPGKPQSVRRSLPRRSRRSARGFAPSLKGSANEAGSANGSLR